MTPLERALGIGLDAVQALPRRGRVRPILAVAIMLIIALRPELLLDATRFRLEPIVEAVTQSAQDVGARTEGE